LLGGEGLHEFDDSQHDTVHTDSETFVRPGEATGTLSGIIRNYYDSDVGVAARPLNEESRVSSSYTQDAIPLLSRSDSRHAADYFRVHGHYPPNIYDVTTSDLSTHEVQSEISGEELMQAPLESNPILRVNDHGRHLTSSEENSSPVGRAGLVRPTLLLNTQPSAAPHWPAPETPDRPPPLFSRPVDSTVTFSNPGLSYTSTNQLLATASPTRRLEQPPSANWPIQVPQPSSSLEGKQDVGSQDVGRQATYTYQDVSDMYPEDDGLIEPENTIPPIPAMWNRQLSGPLHRHSYNSADESVADMSDDDPAQPRYGNSQNMAGGDNRYSGTDWETIPNETSRAGSVPELPGGVGRSAGSRPFREHIDRSRTGDPRTHGAFRYVPSDEQIRDYNAQNPYAMNEDWNSVYQRGEPSYNPEGNGNVQKYLYRQRPTFIPDEDLSPEPNDDFEYVRNSFVHGAYQQPDEARQVQRQRDIDLSYCYPTGSNTGGYMPPQGDRIIQQVDTPHGPLAEIIPMPAQTYNPHRARASTLSRSDAPASAYNDSQRQFPHYLSLDPLISDNGSGPNTFEMSAIRGERRYSRMPSARATTRRAVNWQTEPQQLHLSPTNGRQSTATDTTTWGGFMNKLTRADSRNGTSPPTRYAASTPRAPTLRGTLHRQESGTALLPRRYPTDVEKQFSGHEQIPSDGNTFSIFVLILSASFIIFLPLYSYGKLDVAIQWYTRGSKQTYAKKYKIAALIIFAVEVTGISVAAIMGGVMSKNA
jgi:hypothetical protein